ncbi:hypothetical protein FSARC_7198 [Fusarium sarcochroum]|uniref:Uncharacterized protein n=1 Tax=Fusarium sarcochroum TaxID=1208366 RepID=A0A8H4TVK1_9HYPO|nr:hypothetical protein FSARC_7198 [Fusarium sarcochroum]
MPAPGADFINSLSILFEEAGSNSRDGNIEFAHLRSPILEFIASCGHMTAAKARANCNLRFIDGTEPDTILALPPSKLSLDEKRPQLDTANTSEEFVEILRDLINKQKSPRRSPRQKSAGKKRTNTPPESPRNKTQRRLEAAAADKAADATENSLKKTPRLKLRRGIKQGVPDPPAFKVAQQPTGGTISEPPSDGKSANQIDPNMPGPMDIDIDTNSVSALSQGETTTTQENPNNADITQGSNTLNPPHDQEDTHMENVSTADAEVPPANCRPGTHEVAYAAKDIESYQWDEFKPKLLEMLAKMNADPTPEETSAALKRLQSAIVHLELERALIPAVTWNKYEKKLVDAAKKGLFENPWSERQERVGRIIYLQEEEEVMESRDWDRLRAAARIWAIITEWTAPPQEPVDKELAEKWLVERLGDIAFLERLFACKERIAAIESPQIE